MKKAILFIALFLLSLHQLFAQCEPIEASDSVQYVADDIVNASVKSGNLLYLGGKFGMIGRYTGHFGAVDTANGKGYMVGGLPKVNGHIYKICADGNGGWFIAGEFTKVGNQTRNYLAQIDANGVLTSFNANIVGSAVEALYVSGNTLYVGGWFATVMGQARTKLAAFDIPSGTLKPWNPTSNSDVTAITGYGNKLYLGGSFSQINGQTRHFIASVDSVNGTVTSWNPNMSQYVLCLAANGGKIYAGGAFSTVGGQTRNRLAAIDTLTGLPTSWNPNPNDLVRAIIANDSNIYVTGAFSYIDTATRMSLAKFNTTTGALTPFSIPFSWFNVGYDLVLSSNTLFVSGNFSISTMGFTHFSIAKINLTTLAVDNLNSWGSFQTSTIGLNNNILYGGGTFRSMLNAIRTHAAAIDMAADTITNFKPNPPYFVNALTTAPGKLFTAGAGIINLYDSVTSAQATFNPTFPSGSSVFDMLWYNNSLYFCGDFSQINSSVRRNLAAVNMNGVLTSWNPNPYYNRGIKKLLLHNGLIYACGSFDTLGFLPRKNLAALDPNTGWANNWNPETNDSVLTMDFCGDDLLIGGRFYMVNGQQRNFLAKVNATTGNLSTWNPSPTGFVRTIKTNDGIAYLGGTFYSINGVPNYGCTSIDTSSNSPSTWNPLFETFSPSVIAPAVNDFNFNNKLLYVVGSFDSVNNNCAQQAISIYKIRTMPMDVAINGNIVVCASDTLNLTAASTVAGATYQWLVNGSIMGATAALSYPPNNNDLVIATATAPSGSCYLPALAMNSISIQVNPTVQPAISINSNVQQAYAGNNVTVSAQFQNINTSYSIKWYLNGVYATTTNNANVFNFIKTGADDTITAFVYVVGGCYNPDSAISNTKIVTTLFVGIEETSFTNIKIYPNPARETLHISNVSIGDEIVLYSVTGKKTMQTICQYSSIDLSLIGINKGLYFLEIKDKTGNEILHKKVEIL